MTSTVVRSVRMPAAHWAFVVARAKHLDISPNAWMTRMVKKQIEKSADLAIEAVRQEANRRGTSFAKVSADGDITHIPAEQVHIGPVSPKPGSRLKRR